MGLLKSQANGKYQRPWKPTALHRDGSARQSHSPSCRPVCVISRWAIGSARGSFVTALSMGDAGNAEHQAAHGKASAMLAILEQAGK